MELVDGGLVLICWFWRESAAIGLNKDLPESCSTTDLPDRIDEADVAGDPGGAYSFTESDVSVCGTMSRRRSLTYGSSARPERISFSEASRSS